MRYTRSMMVCLALGISPIPFSLAQNPTSEQPIYVSMNDANPLLVPSSLPLKSPEFGRVKNEHFLPAFEAAMKEQLEEVMLIAESKEPPTFDNTLVALEKTGEALNRVQAVFFHLASAHTNDDIQEIEATMAPRLAAHFDDIYLNKKLFQRVESLWNQREAFKDWNEEQQRLLQEYYEGFVRAGAKLNDAEQKRIREINEQLSSATTQFQNNLLALTKERSVIIDNVDELAGMSDADIAAAAQAAEARDMKGKYLLPITNTTRQPVLTSLSNRETRQKVWEASANRGLGEKGGIDNQPLVIQLAQLRAERAKILGFDSHASFTLQNQMAKNSEAAFKMLQDLAPGVVTKAKQEAEDIKEAMKVDGITDDVQPWDWEYYAEKVRATKYQVDENLVKPYFEINRVLVDGMFYTYGKLYGISFKERHDLPIYHPSVRVFDVIDKDGDLVGIFYADYYARDSKRGGAWMNSFVDQARLLNQLPVIVNVMNIPEPAKGEPTLLSLDHVVTMFHELGHGVHGLFSDVEYPRLSGTSVPRDFVEFPSTVHEDWAIHPEVLANYAKHYKTGEPLPKELLEKSIAASKFNKGYETLEYLAAALLDLGWHSLAPEEKVSDVVSFESKILAKYGVDFAPVPPRYRSTYFAHIFAGGYSAGYYAYMWSEVLAADAFEYMQQQGGLNPEIGGKFRQTVLSRGGSRDVMKQYIDFRGAEPNVEALLIRRGLK
ncbi:M3 family metallopeptidase [Pirellulaceae bacterium SH449]